MPRFNTSIIAHGIKNSTSSGYGEMKIITAIATIGWITSPIESTLG